MNRTRQRALHRPATEQALAEDPRREAQSLRPLLRVHRLAAPCQGSVVARAVVGLHSSRCPTTILWCIAAGPVDSVESQAGRAWAHLGQERFEGIAPFLAHRDASRSVVGVPFVPGVVAPFLGVLPREIFSRAASSVCGVPLNQSFSSQAATAHGLSVPEPGARDHHFRPAGTHTEPDSLACIAETLTYNAKSDQPAERQSRAYRYHGRSLARKGTRCQAP